MEGSGLVTSNSVNSRYFVDCLFVNTQLVFEQIYLVLPLAGQILLARVGTVVHQPNWKTNNLFVRISCSLCYCKLCYCYVKMTVVSHYLLLY